MPPTSEPAAKGCAAAKAVSAQSAGLAFAVGELPVGPADLCALLGVGFGVSESTKTLQFVITAFQQVLDLQVADLAERVIERAL